MYTRKGEGGAEYLNFQSEEFDSFIKIKVTGTYCVGIERNLFQQDIRGKKKVERIILRYNTPVWRRFCGYTDARIWKFEIVILRVRYFLGNKTVRFVDDTFQTVKKF